MQPFSKGLSLSKFKSIDDAIVEHCRIVSDHQISKGVFTLRMDLAAKCNDEKGASGQKKTTPNFCHNLLRHISSQVVTAARKKAP